MTQHPKPFIIPVFLPQAGCPHQCVFCNQFIITGKPRPLPGKNELHQGIQEYLTFKSPYRRPTQIAFFGGNFLGLPDQWIEHCLGIAEHYVTEGRVDGIRFSTRPDNISEKSLDRLSGFSVSTIEIGAQSMDERVLQMSNRGHSVTDTINALDLLKQRHYETGIQMMVGLPGDTEETVVGTTQKIIARSPGFVRIYPTIVLAKSLLAKWYQNGRYVPLTLSACVSLVKKAYLRFKQHHIPVIRMGLQTTPELQKNGHILAGPYHPSFGHLVYSEICLDQITSILNSRKPLLSRLDIRVNPKNISIVRGINNHNIKMLTRRYAISSIEIRGDDTLSREEWIIAGHKKKFLR